MNEILESLNRFSLKRLLKDAVSGFGFLRTVPAADVQVFIEYTDSLPVEETTTLIECLYMGRYPALGKLLENNIDLRTVPEIVAKFEAAREKLCYQWRLQPISHKNTLIALFEARGKVPSSMVSPERGISLNDLKKMKPILRPTEKEMVAALKKHFAVQKRSEDGGRGSAYLISRLEGAYTFETQLQWSLKGSMISYNHRIIEIASGRILDCMLFEHVVSWGGLNWNLIEMENLETAVMTLRKIVDVFEELARGVK